MVQLGNLKMTWWIWLPGDPVIVAKMWLDVMKLVDIVLPQGEELD